MTFELCLPHPRSSLMIPFPLFFFNFKSIFSFSQNIRMAPNQPPNQPDPAHPPKRETQPMSIPTVGVGKDQVTIRNI